MTDSRLIRLPEVLEQVGFSQRTLYRKVENQTFPQPIAIAWDKLGRSTMNMWRTDEIADWQKNPTTYRRTNKQNKEKTTNV